MTHAYLMADRRLETCSSLMFTGYLIKNPKSRIQNQLNIKPSTFNIKKGARKRLLC